MAISHYPKIATYQHTTIPTYQHHNITTSQHHNIALPIHSPSLFNHTPVLSPQLTLKASHPPGLQDSQTLTLDLNSLRFPPSWPRVATSHPRLSAESLERRLLIFINPRLPSCPLARLPSCRHHHITTSQHHHHCMTPSPVVITRPVYWGILIS
jgi:hypothetical protein